MKRKIAWICAGAAVLLLFAADVLTGSTQISPGEVWAVLTGGDVDAHTRAIVLNIRLLKALTAVLAGVAVSVSGLMMQTVFRNPLAGPYVLGVSSGASLGAALFVLGAGSLGPGGLGDGLGADFGGGFEIGLGAIGLAGAAWIGAGAVLAIIIGVCRRIKDIMVILILGMMLGAGIDAVVQVLQFWSDETALKAYVVWTMGSLGNVTWEQFWILGGVVSVGIALAVGSTKGLNLLLLGENYAATMGLNVGLTRNVIFTATVLLAGSVTAFCGPVGFVGLAVPHLARMVTRSANHLTLLPGTVLCGAGVMLACDMVSKLIALPINAITSLLGIPAVVWVVLRERRGA